MESSCYSPQCLAFPGAVLHRFASSLHRRKNVSPKNCVFFVQILQGPGHTKRNARHPKDRKEKKRVIEYMRVNF